MIGGETWREEINLHPGDAFTKREATRLFQSSDLLAE